ncbi:MAG: MobA/MobL family protein [Selenomonadaceae bacterium]|nr:MobA/MobL family protein [Selenomonadaceae bacterium]
MAMYHFRIKSDKKPNGARVSAVKHVEYINREGTFAHDEHWKETNKFVDNFITTAQTPNVLDGLNALLYKTDDFGSIKNSPRGIEVTDNASLTTIAIALMLADELTQHKPLIVNGSATFCKSVLIAAVQANLNLSFQDKLVQRAFQQKKAEQDISLELDQSALLSTKKILENVAEAQKQQSAVSHVEYINREKAYENRGGCIFQFHHLPKWAHDEPKKFFKAADKYEGVGHRRYVEIEFALPNELKTVEQYRQIIDTFIAKHLQDHYYAYAIHNKIGMLSDGQHHPHVHIMFSERLIDDVEKKKERTAKSFFMYPARKKKDGSQPSFEEKWKRGAPKDRKWCSHQYVRQMREDFAQIQNSVLEQNGFSIRVDHRTLKAQKEEAEQNGDSFLARLFSRMPEKYIGIIGNQEDDEPRLERLKHFRSLRKQHFDLVMKLDALTKEADELEVKDAVLLSSTAAKSLMDSEEYERQKFVSPHLAALKSKMLTAVAQVNRWKRFIISQHDAELQAKLEYMTKAERQIWLNYFQMLAQKKHLEDFLTTLKKPDEKQSAEMNAYNDIVAGVKAKIFTLFTSSLKMKKSVEEIQHRLDSPEFKNNIALVTHQILQSNAYALKWLKKASDELDKAIAELKNALVVQTMEEPQTSFKTREVHDLIRSQYRSLKKEYENTFADKCAIRRQIISPERAISMAKNIFVHGDFKRLRESIRRFKKDEQRLAQKFRSYTQEEQKFKMQDWAIFPRSTFLQSQYYLTKQQTLLAFERARLDHVKLSLKKKQSELELLCQQHEATRKIEEIAAGILRKNFRFVRQLEEVESREKELIPRINHTKEQLNALEVRIARDKVNTRYRVTVSDTLTNNQAASLIADAILFDPQVVQLVARSTGNNLEMEKDWELMSELDKDELLDKKIVREL